MYKAKLFNMGATQKFMKTNENETLGSSHTGHIKNVQYYA